MSPGSAGPAIRTPPAARLDGMLVRHGERPLVGPLSLELSRGTTSGLAGPSGSGKSTTLRAMVGLLPPGLVVSGVIEVLGRDVRAAGVDLSALRARAVVVGQTPVVFPASILANAAFGVRRVMRVSRSDLRDRVKRALIEAGLWKEVADRLEAPAEQLSVGQRQRLCLARALALDPELLLLDEPTSALDPKATAMVEEAIMSLQGRAVVIVSHDAAQLERLCSTIIHLSCKESDKAPATRVATGDEGGSKVPPRSVVATGPHGWLS